MKIALVDYGKVGEEIEKAALSRGHEIISIVDTSNQDDFESETFKSAGVAIEFTNPMVAYGNCMRTFKTGAKLVSGSTGWMAKHGDEVKELYNEGRKTLFWSSNFSLDVAIFSAINKYLAKIMNQFPAYDVTMSKTHHVHEPDAPSGMAVTLTEGTLGNMECKNIRVEEETYSANELPIHSIREGEVSGIRTTRYDSEAGSVSITHDTKDREGFTLDTVLTAEYTATHEDYLGINDLFPFLKG